MKIKILFETFPEISVSDCGKYCGTRKQGVAYCDDLYSDWGNYHCNRFPAKGKKQRKLKIEDSKPLRCKACHGAERMAEERGEREN
jgi:hypothetical protein